MDDDARAEFLHEEIHVEEKPTSAGCTSQVAPDGIVRISKLFPHVMRNRTGSVWGTSVRDRGVSSSLLFLPRDFASIKE